MAGTISKMNFFLLAMALLHLGTRMVHGHGRFIEPPSRASMWRYGWDTPIDWNDNQSFCGGFDVQWGVNEGKCGICGDPYDQPDPREHEAGGTYGLGIIVANYTEGHIVDVNIEITANHIGFFQFKICAVEDEEVEVSQDCLDSNALEIYGDFEGDEKTEYHINTDLGFFPAKVKLPDGLICDHCVIQWTYTAGNAWGECEDGHFETGCGPQETFRGCADVAIFSS